MRRLSLLISLCFVALLLVSSVALADTTMMASPSASASGISPPCSAPNVICDYVSVSPSGSVSASASALSPSGGESPLKLAIVSALLLVGSGLLTARIMRRS
jgi:hypothetical protein